MEQAWVETENDFLFDLYEDTKMICETTPANGGQCRHVALQVLS